MAAAFCTCLLCFVGGQHGSYNVRSGQESWGKITWRGWPYLIHVIGHLILCVKSIIN